MQERPDFLGASIEVPLAVATARIECTTTVPVECPAILSFKTSSKPPSPTIRRLDHDVADDPAVLRLDFEDELAVGGSSLTRPAHRHQQTDTNSREF